MEAFALLFDALVLFIVWRVWLFLRRGSRPTPIENWQPSDDARSGRRITLLIFPKGTRR